MQIHIEVPSSKPDPLLKQLLTQFERLQKQLMKVSVTAATKLTPLVALLSKQQEPLVRAMERLLSQLKPTKTGADPALAKALMGMQGVLKQLPNQLEAALDGSYQRTQKTLAKSSITVKPQVQVHLDGVGKRLDRMQEALVQATRRSRSRTFGSNY